MWRISRCCRKRKFVCNLVVHRRLTRTMKSKSDFGCSWVTMIIPWTATVSTSHTGLLNRRTPLHWLLLRRRSSTSEPCFSSAVGEQADLAEQCPVVKSSLIRWERKPLSVLTITLPSECYLRRFYRTTVPLLVVNSRHRRGGQMERDLE